MLNWRGERRLRTLFIQHKYPQTPRNSISCNDHITFDSYTFNVDKNYHAYLIRFKRRETQSSWCATLEDVHTRETRTFATERELLVYLLQTLSEHPATTEANTEVDTES
jgi:hypothetical protein